MDTSDSTAKAAKADLKEVAPESDPSTEKAPKTCQEEDEDTQNDPDMTTDDEPPKTKSVFAQD